MEAVTTLEMIGENKARVCDWVYASLPEKERRTIVRHDAVTMLRLAKLVALSEPEISAVQGGEQIPDLVQYQAVCEVGKVQ